MGSTRASAALPIAGWSSAGMVVGHVAAYRVAFPDPHAHAFALAASGHSWLELVIPAVLLFVVVASVAGLVGGWRSRQRGVRFTILAIIQVLAYVAIEVVERVAAGADGRVLLHELRDHGLWLVLVVGCAFQVITAWLGSAASRAVSRSAATRLRAALHRPIGPRVVHAIERVVVSGTSRAYQGRAPPLLSRLAPIRP